MFAWFAMPGTTHLHRLPYILICDICLYFLQHNVLFDIYVHSAHASLDAISSNSWLLRQRCQIVLSLVIDERGWSDIYCRLLPINWWWLQLFYMAWEFEKFERNWAIYESRHWVSFISSMNSLIHPINPFLIKAVTFKKKSDLELICYWQKRTY